MYHRGITCYSRRYLPGGLCAQLTKGNLTNTISHSCHYLLTQANNATAKILENTPQIENGTIGTMLVALDLLLAEPAVASGLDTTPPPLLVLLALAVVLAVGVATVSVE